MGNSALSLASTFNWSSKMLYQEKNHKWEWICMNYTDIYHSVRACNFNKRESYFIEISGKKINISNEKNS